MDSYSDPVTQSALDFVKEAEALNKKLKDVRGKHRVIARDKGFALVACVTMYAKDLGICYNIIRCGADGEPDFDSRFWFTRCSNFDGFDLALKEFDLFIRHEEWKDEEFLEEQVESVVPSK